MALPDLAATADLTLRGIDITQTGRVAAYLAAASTSVREASGHPILRSTATIELPGECDHWLHLPGGPVTAVTSVLINGAAVTDYTRQGDDLWRDVGWAPKPATTVKVACTAGLVEVPADIVDLVCNMVAYALAHAKKGWAVGRKTREAIDDYNVGYADPGEFIEDGLFELPEATRLRLRARFGGGVATVRFAR